MIEITALNSPSANPIILKPPTNGSGGNYIWSLRSDFGPLRDPLALDLADIACSVHLADRSIRRSRFLGKRMRRIRVKIAVRRPTIWKRLAGKLEELLGFASADLWDLEFDRTARPVKEKANRRAKSPAAGVALFSGGLDSLCGAALRGARAEDWVFVTHSPPGRKKTERLLRDVWTAFGRDPSRVLLASCKLEVRERDSQGKRNHFPEPSRRSRPFFFLSLACAVAIDLELRRVQMSENGALGLNLPFRHDAYGGSIARQAHSYMLRGFAEVLELIKPGDEPWSVENPLEHKTKGEACEILGPASKLAERTLSCEYTGHQAARVRNWKKVHPGWAKKHRVGEGPQCGICLPCLVRRAALHRARIDDPDRLYFFDARRVAAWLPNSAGQIAGRDGVPPLLDVIVGHPFYLRQFCNQLRSSTAQEFMLNYLPEVRWAADSSGKLYPDASAPSDLMRRYAVEILSFLERSS